MKQRKIFFKVINTLWVGALGILFLVPLLWMFSASLKTGPEIFATPFRFFGETIRWDNYTAVWDDPNVPFWRLYLNSLKIAVIGTAVQLMISSMAGYSFAKIEFKGKNFVFLMILITMMIPAQALIIPRYVLFDMFKLYGTHWALILPSLFNVTSIFLLRQFYAGLPNDLMEAARMDGASHYGIWWKVMLPLTKTPMVTVIVLAFINCWNEYLNPLIFIIDYDKYTVAQGIQYFLYSTDEVNWMMAAAASAIIPVIILFLFTQKYFIESIATSGVKG